jgi:hypothetical protein
MAASPSRNGFYFNGGSMTRYDGRAWRGDRRRRVAAGHQGGSQQGTGGRPPTTSRRWSGTWVIRAGRPDKVVMVDGRPWVASKDNPTKLLIESARKLYGTRTRS